MMMGGLGMGIGMLLVVVLPLVLLFGGGAVVVRYLTDKETARSVVQNTPRQILDNRLANGEINIEEYESIRRQLGTTEVT